MNEQQIWQDRFDVWTMNRTHCVWGEKVEPLIVTDLLRPVFGDILVSAAMYTNEHGPDEGYRKDPRIMPNLEELIVDGYPLFIEFVNGHIVKFATSEWGNVALVANTEKDKIR